MPEKTNRIDHSNDGADSAKSKALLAELRKRRRYIATIKKTVKEGIFEVDVEGLGWKSARCYETWAQGSGYEDGAKVIVAADDSGVCFILPRELPRGPGKTKVVQAIDDSDPATLDLDYLRFKAGALDQAQDS